jgi:CheY-like chemotaxis protein
MFPCTEPPQDPESRKPEPLPELHASILVVDDDPAVRRTIRSFLEAAGADVMEARSGEQALELAPGSDLVVTDIVMPAMCGTQLREGLEASGCPVLLMSGHSLGHYVTQGLLDPSDPFLQKPFSQRDLVTAVAALLHV